MARVQTVSADDPSLRVGRFAGDPFLRVGRFAGDLYGVVGILALLWGFGAGRWDGWLAAFVAVCGGGKLLTLLPWEGRGELLAKAMVLSAAAVSCAFMPLLLETPALLLGTGLAAAYTGATLDRSWLLSLVPSAIVLGLLRSSEAGLREGWAEAGLYLGLWVTIGSVSVWMRDEVSASNQAVLEAQAASAERARQEADRQAAESAEIERQLNQRVEVATSVRELVESVRSASDRVEAQSSNIASAVDQLASGLNETSSTSEAAQDIVRRIATTTTESQEIIAQLDRAGQQIVGIVDTIADLSEQTNLLALNASIESARAGDAGKGFAVVANEVKELAQQTAKSASGIGAVIDQVQGRLDDSARAMGAVADLVSELESSQSILGQSVAEQTAVVGNIANAANTGADGMSEIGRAIRQLDHQAGRLADDRNEPIATAPTR